jgi:hypothetical protein
VIHDVLTSSQICLKPIEPSPKPTFYDEIDRHGLTCHVTRRDELATDVDADVAMAARWQMTWMPGGR